MTPRGRRRLDAFRGRRNQAAETQDHPRRSSRRDRGPRPAIANPAVGQPPRDVDLREQASGRRGASAVPAQTKALPQRSAPRRQLHHPGKHPTVQSSQQPGSASPGFTNIRIGPRGVRPKRQRGDALLRSARRHRRLGRRVAVAAQQRHDIRFGPKGHLGASYPVSRETRRQAGALRRPRSALALASQ